MSEYFSYKGISSETYGVYITDIGVQSSAEERVEFEPALGRSGDIAFLEDDDDEVLEDVTRQVDCVLRDPAQMDAVKAWLSGSGALILPDRPGGHYDARIVKQIDFEKIVRTWSRRLFTVNFRLHPYWIHDGVQDIVINSPTASQLYSISNPGTVSSLPRIKITGSGDFMVMIGSRVMRFKDITGGIIVDSAIPDAFSLDAAELRNRNVGGEFLRIPSGSSTISWIALDEDDNAGTVTKIEITPRWRSR